MHKMKRMAWTLAATVALTAPAHALDMMVWDAGLQVKLAYAETVRTEAGGPTLRGQMVQGVSGPVVVLFSPSEAEKASRAFAALANRYEGELKGGRLTLKLPSGVQSLEKFLEGYGFGLDLKPVAAGEGAMWPPAERTPELPAPQRQAVGTGSSSRGGGSIQEAAPQRTGPLQPATLENNVPNDGTGGFLKGVQ